MEIKERLINRLNNLTEELQVLEKEFAEFIVQLPKDRKDISKLQSIQGGFNNQKLSIKGYEFVILTNILIEEYKTDFELEVSINTKNRYNNLLKEMESLLKKDIEIPEELKSFLESNKN